MVHGPVLAGASTGQVPLVQSCFSRALSIIVDGSEQPFLTGISRARDELAMSLPRITNLHEKLLCHNEVRRSYCDVASAVLENLALNRDVYTGVDYASLIQTTQQLLGQTATPVSLPVPYSPSTVTAAAAAPATSAPASFAPHAASAAAAAPALAFPLPPPAAALYLTPPPPSFS